MILPTACINWAALRSGLSLPDFMASLNPQREEEILKSYNAWRNSKGLPEARPCVPKPPVAHKPSVAVAKPVTQSEDEPQDDDISGLVSKIADQLAREELEEAELIQEALRLPEERIPRELEEELEMEAMAEEADTAQAAASQAATEPQVEANTAPQTATAPQAGTASSEAAATVPSEVAATEQQTATAPTEVAATALTSEAPSTAPQQSPAPAPQVEPDGPIMEADISERFLTIARTLPKVADPALYQEILGQLDAPAEVVKSLAEETRKLYTAKHRSTVGLRAFIEWLSNNQHTSRIDKMQPGRSYRKMRYELEILEKIMFYDTEGITTRFPLYVYRTKEKVNREALEAAVGYAIQCHPLFGCRLAEDEKGPYLETNPEKPVIPELNPDEMYHYGDSSNHNYPWIVGCRDREIIYTGYHGITDGMGATMFMRTVLYYYFKAQGIECAPGKAVTIEKATPEYLEKETECSIRKHGTEDVPSLYKPSALQPTVFPGDMLVEDTEACAIHNLAISLADIKGKSAEYDVSQFAVIATYVAQAICSVLAGEDNVVMMNIIADMRGMLDSSTTHNCVMSVPVTFSQKDLMKSDELICTMFRARLDLGFNKDEVLHSCFNSAQLEQQIGGSKEYLAGAAMQITKQYGFNAPVASVAYTHLTHTGFSDDMLRELDDVYINTSGFKVMGKQAIIALNAVTTDKLINLLMVDGTKGERILKALEKRLTESQVSFETTELDKYKGIIYRR